MPWRPYDVHGRPVPPTAPERIWGYEWTDPVPEGEESPVPAGETVEIGYLFGRKGMLVFWSEEDGPHKAFGFYDELGTNNPAADQKIAELHPRLRPRVKALLLHLRCRYRISLMVLEGQRSVEEQDRLYAQGRTAPGEIVTRVKGGYSYHNYGLAVDVVPVRNGMPDWESPHWELIGRIGEWAGLEWGGRWEFVDKAHFQQGFGQTLDTIRTLPRDPEGFVRLPEE